ncbi:interactor of constitutive active ROPs 1-like isoform X2 [Andrographis paniculata]|nr:interactor of constitutive active ROPs 1-like isoform X2 [Andrographis paniculata]
MSQRSSSTRGPPGLRTSSSDSSLGHHRMRTERSPKLGDGRSPRGSQSDPLHQKKLGTRIADLESQLGQAQVELKSLKNQLVSAEAAKKAAQEQLEKKSKKQAKVREVAVVQEKHSMAKKGNETSKDLEEDEETDVFEVPIEKLSLEAEIEPPIDQNVVKLKSVCSEEENSSLTELDLKNGEINVLQMKLDDAGKELEVLRQENISLKQQLDDEELKITSSESAIEELRLRLKKADEELEKSKIDAVQMNRKLEASEKAKEELEAEMTRLRVQTKQWRKAADAAASVLAREMDTDNGRRISERCGSMNKHYYDSGYAGGGGSPQGRIDESDDVFGSGKRKGSGMKMLGDLWKKKSHK